MMRFMKQVAPVLSLVVLGTATVAGAGSTSDYALCYKATDGSGYCYGTLRGFRNHVNPGTYLYFHDNSMGTRSMAVGFPLSSPTGTISHFGCSPNSAVAALWSKVMAHRGYIEVAWDVNGICTSMYLFNGSNYSDF